MDSPSDTETELKLRWRRYVPAVLALALGLATSLTAYFFIHEQEQRRIQNQFRRSTETHNQFLKQGLERYSSWLDHFAEHLSLTNRLSGDQFIEMAALAVNFHPAINGLAWLPWVPEEGRAAFESSNHPPIAGPVRIVERDAAAKLVPAGAHSEYFPMLWSVSQHASQWPPGLDMASVGRRAAYVAGRSGVTLVSEITGAGQSTAVRASQVITPVYASGDRHTHGEFLGFLHATMDLAELFSLGLHDFRSGGLDALIFLSNRQNRIPIYFHSAGLRSIRLKHPLSEPLRGAWTMEGDPLQFGGYAWPVIYRASPEWLANHLTYLPESVLVSGLAFSLLLSAYLLAVARRTVVVQRLVRVRTRELTHSNELLQKEIREREATAEALRRSEARLVEAQRIGEIGSWELDLRSDRLAWSPETYRIFGRELGSEVSDQLFFDSIHAEDRDYVWRESQASIAAGAPYHLEHRIIRPDGSIRHVAEHAEFIRDVEGKPLLMLGTVQDITDRKKAESALIESEQRFRLIGDSAPVLIWLTDAAHNFVTCNRRWHQFTGRSVEQEKGRGWMDGFPVDDRPSLELQFDAAFEARQPFRIEHPFRRADGAMRWFLNAATPRHDGQGLFNGFIGTAIDITDQRDAHEAQINMERKLQEGQKLESLGVLAGGVAHDFNNLLTGILGNASLARLDAVQGSSLENYLEHIETSALRAADLCKQMLAYSGKGRFVVKKVNLSLLVEDTIELLQASISKKAVIELDLAPNLTPVLADATQMRQIIMNLVINASDAIGETNGIIHIRTASEFRDASTLESDGFTAEAPPGHYVVLEVSDTGSGMSDETRLRIFEPFYTTKFTGRGLGLAAVLGIVRGHMGTIRVESELGRGTRFTLLLPVADGEAERPVQRSLVEGAWRGSGDVLLVDDEETVRSVVGRMLESFGFKVFRATNGREALGLLEDHRASIKLVMLDLTMPEMDGAETYHSLRRISAQVPVLLMSGYNEQEALNRFVGEGLAGFLQKPFRPEALRVRLEEIFKPKGGNANAGAGAPLPTPPA